jgi:hypothetical protein
MASFAKVLESDFQQYENALIPPWSNGAMEGKINKLKTIKTDVRQCKLQIAQKEISPRPNLTLRQEQC